MEITKINTKYSNSNVMKQHIDGDRFEIKLFYILFSK